MYIIHENTEKIFFRSILIMVLSTFCMMAYSQQQQVRLSGSNLTLKAAFKQIEQQTKMSVDYNVQDVDDTKVIKNMPKENNVKIVVQELLSGTNCSVIFSGNHIIISKQKETLRKVKTVTGVVKDEKGEPVIGANVVVKGTTNGTVSDVDGKFSLEDIPNNAVLEISYMGYLSQEIKVGNQMVLNIALKEDTQTLDEVVVIGYGTVKKSDLTGSVGSVKSGELSAIPQSSAEQALQGRTAGVQVKQTSGAPGETPTVRVRGTNSILGGNDPLYVIDGFPSTQGMGILNVDDIESMEILKDASAIAIYGSRGANGVILITTKKGAVEKVTVEFGTTIGFQSVSKKIDMMNAKEWAEFYNIRAANDGKEPFFTQEQVDAFGEGFDWQDFVFSTAPIRTHSLNISGGTDETKFSVGANIFDQEGIVGKGSYARYSLRANLDQEISKKIKLNFSTNLSQGLLDNKNFSGSSLGNSLTSVALVAPPSLTPYNEDGSYKVFESYYPVITTGGAIINPLNFLNEIKDKRKKNNVLANLSFTYEPIEGMYIKILGGIENADIRNDYYKTKKYYNSTGYASITTTNTTSLLNENTITYMKTFAEKHSINILGGFTYQDYRYKLLSASGTGYMSDVTETGDIGSASSSGVPSSGYTKWALMSTIGRLNYNFDNRYLFTVSFRADGSSRYSKGDKWGYFPSGAIAWRVTEEQFMKPITWLSDLKLRLSYGVSGSQAISPYATLNNLYSGKTVFGNELYTIYSPGSTLPGNLKWESTHQTDIGFDARVFNNRLKFTFDYYYKKTKNLLNNIPLPSSTGYSQTIGNVGEVNNKGLELTVSALAIDNTNFKWTLDGNISFNRSKVKKLYNHNDILGGYVYFNLFNDNASILREGEPMNSFYGYQKNGYDEKGAEIYKDQNNDGVINNDDKVIIGNPNPKFIYGLNSSMTYKGFDFSFFLQGTQGNDMFNASAVDNTLQYAYGLNMRKEVLYDHWTPNNTDAKYPKPVTSMSMRLSDRLIENGSYLRLKNIEIAYNFPIKKWNTPWLQKLRLSFSAQNLFTITKYSGWDPDINTQEGGIGQGIDMNPYPVARTYTFGIHAIF